MENIPSILNLKKHNPNIVEIILVDDGSSDGSVEFIKSNYSQDIRIIQKEKNTGFSDSVNIGVASAQSSLVLLLNTDTKPEESIIKHLLPFFEKASTFAVGCLDSSIENNTNIHRGRGIGKFTKGFLIHSKGNPSVTSTLWVAAGSGIFRRSIWNKLNGLDNNYSPFYWEDLDISYRALKRGYNIYFAKDAVVTHFHEKGSIKTQFSDSEIKKIALRNQIIFVWKNISDTNLLIQHFLYLPYYILSTLLKGDPQFIGALFAALAKFPNIYTKRNIEAKERKYTDKEVLAKFAD